MHLKRNRAGRGPAGPARMSVEEADALLLRVVDAAFAQGARKAGSWLVCAPGCRECCRGPFPITPLDAGRLRRGLVALRALDPPAARRVESRAQAARERLAEGFPGDPEAGAIEAEGDVLEAYLERHAGLDCPALDSASGLCDLYASRPVPCRTYGPPVRVAGDDVPPCRLCFVGAPAETVAACRLDPDPYGLEEALLGRVAAERGADGATLVAFALADPR